MGSKKGSKPRFSHFVAPPPPPLSVINDWSITDILGLVHAWMGGDVDAKRGNRWKQGWPCLNLEDSAIFSLNLTFTIQCSSSIYIYNIMVQWKHVSKRAEKSPLSQNT